MDSQTIWLLVVAAASPIAAVVGFAVQLRQVKQTRLENEKLQLEIAALRKEMANGERRIVLATNEEVSRIARTNDDADIFFSRGGEVGQQNQPARRLRDRLKDLLMAAGVVILLGGFAAYLLFDLYRLVLWLGTWL